MRPSLEFANLPRRAALQAAALALAPRWAGAQDTAARDLAAAECIAPSKPGGGFDLTCALASQAIAKVRPAFAPLRTRYLPGGIGAVAFDLAATGRLDTPHALVAFSSGSLLNIAQGRFGPHPVSAVRWVATLGTDYGVVAVHPQSPLRTLAQLMQALSEGNQRLVFGAGGTLGSQDWMKAALLVRHAGKDPRHMRFVSFEGGGEAIKALVGGHINVFTGDAAEAMKAQAKGAQLRLLAVLSPARLAGPLSHVPTATEQATALVWPTVRGVYMATGAAPATVSAWTAAFAQAHADPGYAALCQAQGLMPHRLTGAALEEYVRTSVDEYRQLARELGLRLWKSGAA